MAAARPGRFLVFWPIAQAVAPAAESLTDRPRGIVSRKPVTGSASMGWRFFTP